MSLLKLIVLCQAKTSFVIRFQSAYCYANFEILLRNAHIKMQATLSKCLLLEDFLLLLFNENAYI